MKKLLVLSLVLAVAGLASAGLTLTAAGGKNLTVASDNSAAYVANLAFVLPVDATVIALTPAGNQNLSYLTDAGVFSGGDLGLDAGKMYHLFSFSAASSVQGALQPGIHLNATANEDLLPQGLVAGVHLLSEDLSTVLGTLYIPQIPEPMTMGLLGLGALFLRKR